MHDERENSKSPGPRLGGLGDNGGPPVRDGNWVAVSRELIEHHVVGAGNVVTPADKNKGSFSRLESWLDLLCMANFRERKVTVHGATLILRPGQTIAGRAFLAKRWNWSEKTVRVWLARLEAELMITLACEELKQGQTKGHLPNVVTICNWGKFQSTPVDQGPDLGQPQGHPRATQGPHLNKETKEQGNKKEEREEAESAPAPPVPYEILRAFEAYNELAQRVGLPIARSLTPQRRKAIGARMREHGGQPAWETFLANIERSAFLQGRNDRSWTPPGLDWLLNASNFTKVFEGAYGNGAHARAAPKETEWERMSRLMGEPSRIDDIEIIPPARRL